MYFWQLLWNNVFCLPLLFFHFHLPFLGFLKYISKYIFLCKCNIKMDIHLILYCMKKPYYLLLQCVLSLLDIVQWTRNMCSCLFICFSSWPSTNKENNHCVCREHLPCGNFIPVWKDSLLLFRLFHCSVAWSKEKISQVNISWSNSITTEDELSFTWNRLCKLLTCIPAVFYFQEFLLRN